MMPKNASGELDYQSLHQKSQRWVHEGKVAIGNLAQRYAVTSVERITQVPQNREVRVLPNDYRSGCGKKSQTSEPFQGVTTVRKGLPRPHCCKEATRLNFIGKASPERRIRTRGLAEPRGIEPLTS